MLSSYSKLIPYSKIKLITDKKTCLVVDLVVGEAAGEQLVENYPECVDIALECVRTVVHHPDHCYTTMTSRFRLLKRRSSQDFHQDFFLLTETCEKFYSRRSVPVYLKFTKKHVIVFEEKLTFSQPYKK